MTDYILKAETGHINLSPVWFRLAAQDYFKCYLDFETLRRFSVVPYFLGCRAMELALKAIHLETKRQLDVKKAYSHDLVKLYSDLPTGKQTLAMDEVKLLEAANGIYSGKGFEYIYVQDASTGYERFPHLQALADLARKITAYDA